VVNSRPAGLAVTCSRGAESRRPLALSGGSDFVPGQLGDDLPLEMGKGNSNVEHSGPSRSRCECLGGRRRNETRWVYERASSRAKSSRLAQPVDLVHHDAVKPAGLDAAMRRVRAAQSFCFSPPPNPTMSRRCTAVAVRSAEGCIFIAAGWEERIPRFQLAFERVDSAYPSS